MRYVYLLKADDRYKVGIAKNVPKRVKTIQTSNPEPIEIITSRLVINEEEIERNLHDLLADMRAEGGREWFRLNYRQALLIAMQINSYPEVDLSHNVDLYRLAVKQANNQQVIEEKLDQIFDLMQRKSTQ